MHNFFFCVYYINTIQANWYAVKGPYNYKILSSTQFNKCTHTISMNKVSWNIRHLYSIISVGKIQNKDHQQTMHIIYIILCIQQIYKTKKKCTGTRISGFADMLTGSVSTQDSGKE